MKDILNEFDQKKENAPKRIRIIGLIRIAGILLMIFSVGGIIMQYLDMSKGVTESNPLSYITLTAILLIVILAIFHSISQMILEFKLNIQAYNNSKFRWASNLFYILFLALVAYIYLLPNKGYIIPTPFHIIFSILCSLSLTLLAADLQYAFRFKRNELL